MTNNVVTLLMYVAQCIYSKYSEVVTLYLWAIISLGLGISRQITLSNIIIVANIQKVPFTYILISSDSPHSINTQSMPSSPWLSLPLCSLLFPCPESTIF